MALPAGTKLGPYEIQSPLGAGGMGEVYRGRDTRLDRTVAVKVLTSHLSDNPELKQRFEREAKAISSLNHPNICTLHDIGSQDGVDFLVMEWEMNSSIWIFRETQHLFGSVSAAKLVTAFPLPTAGTWRLLTEIRAAICG